ncbi:hypothetical protein RSAG8_05819, partial [Rhizoctonia solani AG-8 WAC10335]
MVVVWALEWTGPGRGVRLSGRVRVLRARWTSLVMITRRGCGGTGMLKLLLLNEETGGCTGRGRRRLPMNGVIPRDLNVSGYLKTQPTIYITLVENT